MDYEVKRCTRRCLASDRELGEGEEFYSALVAQGADVERQDFSLEGWTEPPEGTIAWWKSRMPFKDNKQVMAPNEVLLELFKQRLAQEDKQDEAYVLALLMIRRRIVRLEQTKKNEEGHEIFVLSCAREDASYEVRVTSPTAQRVTEIQDQLTDLLYNQAE